MKPALSLIHIYYLDGNEQQKHVEIINTKGETVWESPYATREIEQNMIAHDPYFSITYLTKVFDGKAVFWHTEQGVNTTCVLLGTDGSKQELPASMLEDSSVEYVVAHGISSMVENQKVVIGSYHFVFEEDVYKRQDKGLPEM